MMVRSSALMRCRLACGSGQYSGRRAASPRYTSAMPSRAHQGFASRSTLLVIAAAFAAGLGLWSADRWLTPAALPPVAGRFRDVNAADLIRARQVGERAHNP